MDFTPLVGGALQPGAPENGQFNDRKPAGPGETT